MNVSSKNKSKGEENTKSWIIWSCVVKMVGLYWKNVTTMSNLDWLTYCATKKLLVD